MNKIIRNSFMAVFAVVALAGCDENDWNEKYLDGFTGGVVYDSTTTAEYTLTTSDYSAITKNTTNTALAEAAGQSAALKAVASNECFSTAITAKEYLPAFMKSSSFPYYLANDGSVINVTYNQTEGVTDTYNNLLAATQYTVTTADYQTAWGSEEDYIEAFAPGASASKKLPSILKSQLGTDFKSGDYVIVTYNEATENPVFGTSDEEEKPLDFSTLTNGDVVKFNGQIAAFSNYGPVIATEGGNGFVYDKNTAWATTYAVGDQVEVEATVYNYYGALEFTSPTVTKTGTAAMTYPTPTVWSASDIATFMDEVTAAKSGSPIPARYIQFTGKLTVSGNYYNFYMDGEETKYIGLYQATDTQKAALTNGETYTVTGYAITTGTKGVNLIPTFIGNTNVAASAKTRSVVSTPSSKSVTVVYEYSGSVWAEADDVAALSASDYTAMGVSNNKLTDATTYLPLFLKNKYPYALAGDQMYVVYNNGTVAMLDYDGSKWTVNNECLTTVTTQWKRVDGAWKFVKTVGVAVFNIVTGGDLPLDKKYIMVADGICANPLAASYNYGYLTTTAIRTDGTTIEMASDESAFQFVSTYVNGDVTIQAPAGQFLIKDNNDRYLYMSGTYNSFNITATPVVDGAINSTALFTAKSNGDGTWTIATSVGGSDKWIQYSTNYGSWGCYSSEQGLCPAIYQLAED